MSGFATPAESQPLLSVELVRRSSDRQTQCKIPIGIALKRIDERECRSPGEPHERAMCAGSRRRGGLVAGGKRGVHAAVVARLPVSRDSSSEPESAVGATIQQPD